MLDGPNIMISKRASFVASNVVAMTITMAWLVVSPFFTLALFHPGGISSLSSIKAEHILDLQISQLEPLLLSFSVLGYLLFYRKVSSRLPCIAIIVTIHMFVSFYLIAIRGEGGLRWFN